MTASPSLYRRMWRLAGPIILANSATPLLGAVDTAIMGHMPGARYLAAVALAALVFSFLYWGFGFLRMSTTGLTAQAYGAHQTGTDKTAMAMTFVRAGVLALGLGILTIALQLPAKWLAFTLFDAPRDIEALARAYFDIRIWSAPAALLNFVILGWLIGTQRGGAALFLQLVLNVCNAGLDAVFVLGFGWGVEGVALGTVCAEAMTALTGLWLVYRALQSDFGIDLRHMLRPDLIRQGDAIRRLIAVNTDIFLRTACLLAVFGLFTNSGARMGESVLAANAVLMNFLMFLSYGLDGFAYAAESLIGAEKGAENTRMLRRVVRVTVLWAGATAVLYALTYAVFGQGIIRLLTDIPGLRALAGEHLPWLVVMPLLAVWGYMLDGIFLGLTRTREMRNTVALSALLYLGAEALLIPAFGNHGLWAAFSLFTITRAMTLGWCYRRLDL